MAQNKCGNIWNRISNVSTRAHKITHKLSVFVFSCTTTKQRVTRIWDAHIIKALSKSAPSAIYETDSATKLLFEVWKSGSDREEP